MIRAPLLLIVDDPERAEKYRHLLYELTQGSEVITDYENGPLLLRKNTPGVVIIDTENRQENALGIALDILNESPDVNVVFTSAEKNAPLILKAMRSGVQEFFIIPGNEDSFVEYLNSKIQQKGPQSERGKLYPVFSTKGGSGTTTIAVNLAESIRRLEGGSILIVDLCLQMGEVAEFMGLQVKYSMSDLVRDLGTPDRPFIKELLPFHASGIHVLAQPDRADETDAITGGTVAQALVFLLDNFDHVIVDTQHVLDEINLAAMDLASHIVVVTTQSIPHIRNTQRILDLFLKLGYPNENIKVVINRYGFDKNINEDSMSEALGLMVAGTIANDFRFVSTAINSAKLLYEMDEKNPVIENMDGLAKEILGMKEESRKGFLRSIFDWRPTP